MNSSSWRESANQQWNKEITMVEMSQSLRDKFAELDVKTLMVVEVRT